MTTKSNKRAIKPKSTSQQMEIDDDNINNNKKVIITAEEDEEGDEEEEEEEGEEGGEDGETVDDDAYSEILDFKFNKDDDPTSLTFNISEEDHTLGNALRYVIMQNPEVEYCGYSIPHPSEDKLNLRVQTTNNITAIDAMHKGLEDLRNICGHITDLFVESNKSYDNNEN
nr:12745_t:CDS:2 [Entrophospora candida]